MEIKRLQPGDEDIAIKAFEAIKNGGTVDCAINHDYMHKILLRDDFYFIGAQAGDIPAGFALGYLLPRVNCEQHMMLIYEVEVSPEFRGQGVGKKMIRILKGYCQDLNVLKMWILTNASNHRAMHLYEATGGKPRKENDLVLFEYFF
jgi:ribosomal protein S18 acetylase RimI-like enzyme